MIEVAVDGPRPGPNRPLERTPPRPAPSVRRTTTVDTLWPDFSTGRVVLDVRGQDLVTAPDGTATVLDHLALLITAELASGRVLEIAGDHEGWIDGILGASLRGGFGRQLAGLLPDEGDRRSLTYSALEDLPGAFLVSGYALLRGGVLEGDPARAMERAQHQADVCIGWATGSPMLTVLAERGQNSVPSGPVAPLLDAADPDGWHAVAGLAPGSMRRRRQLDVWPDAAGGVRVLSHFRDSYAGEDHEMALHEYVVEATVDADGRVASIGADPRTLPWAECPGAVASAAGVVGVALADVGARVRADLVGPTTCTHLSSTLRTLADVQALSAQLDQET